MMFLVSVVLAALGGVKAFMAAGCAQIYVLGDNDICGAAMATLGNFLETLSVNGTNINDACTEQMLMTCEMVSSDVMSATVMTVVGSLLGAVFTFQLLIESSILYERARYRRIIDGLAKGAE